MARSPQTHPERLLRAPDVAALLDVSPSLVYALAETGELACVRVRSSVRFDPADVHAYIDACRDAGLR